MNYRRIEKLCKNRRKPPEAQPANQCQSDNPIDMDMRRQVQFPSP